MLINILRGKDTTMNIEHAKEQQKQIKECENILKECFDYSKQQLENIGLDSPTASDYLRKLQDEIDNLTGEQRLQGFDYGDEDFLDVREIMD